MKRIMKFVTLFTVVTMAVTILAGCQGKKDDTTAGASTVSSAAVSSSSSAAPAVEDPYKDPVELSFALWSIGESVKDGGDKVRDTIYKKLNITIKPVNMTWDDYNNKVLVWAASSQLPDMFACDVVGKATYKDWIQQGIIKQIPSDLSAYPNIKTIMDAESTKVYQYPLGDENGKFYAIPRLNHENADEWGCDTGIMVRKDWMANVGVTKDPETIDEYIDLMKKFVNNDPDNNGKNDTIGMTMFDAAYLRPLIMAYEPDWEHWARDPENPGQWIPGYMTENFAKAMQAMKRLYDEGCIDKDFATLKGEEGEDKFANGKAGAYAHDVCPATLSYVADKYEKINPGKKFDDVVGLMKPLRSENGKFYRFTSVPFWSETCFNAKCDDKKVARGIALLDYLLSDEGYNLIHYGIEGTDWKNENGAVVLTPQKDASGADIPLKNLYPITFTAFISEWSGTRQWTGPSMHPGLQAMSKEHYDWLIANAVPSDYDLRIGYLDIPTNDKPGMVLKDLVIKCVLSKDVEKTLATEIKAFRENGYEQVIKETNDAIKAAGIQ